jgi:hypothetical protein
MYRWRTEKRCYDHHPSSDRYAGVLRSKLVLVSPLPLLALALRQNQVLQIAHKPIEQPTH